MAFDPPLALDLHLGDNANYYAGRAKYCGLTVDLPILITDANGPIALQIATSVIETYDGLKGHAVFLNGAFLGTLTDRNGDDTPETHTFDISAVLLSGAPARLRIECEPIRPGLLDDFILKSIAISGAKLKLGWV